MIALALLVCAMLSALALSSFCSGTETGLSSVSLGRIRHMAREGSAAAKIISLSSVMSVKPASLSAWR